MSADLSATSVETSSGFTIDSSEPITAEERKVLTAKPIPPGAKPGKEAKAETPEFETEAVDRKGRTHAPDGKFKPEAKAQTEEPEEPEETKKPEKKAPAEKPAPEPEKETEETEEARAAKKVDAQSRIRDLAEKKNKAEERAAGLERQLREEREARARESKPAEPKAEPKVEEKKLAERPNIKDFESWDDYQAKEDEWLLAKAEEIAEKTVEKRESARAQAEREERELSQLTEALTLGDKAIKEAGGQKFLDRVAPTMAKIMPGYEAERLGLEQKPIHLLGTFITRTGRHIVSAMEYIHEQDPGIVERFEEIGRLPAARQPLMVERELGMLYGALKALHKVKASATTDTPEPDSVPFKPRATPPPPSVVGSPHVAEPDLSKVEDFDEYMAKKGNRVRR